jgi:hypothetical protein
MVALKSRYEKGSVSKEDFAEVLCAHQAAVDARKVPRGTKQKQKQPGGKICGNSGLVGLGWCTLCLLRERGMELLDKIFIFQEYIVLLVYCCVQLVLILILSTAGRC